MPRIVLVSSSFRHSHIEYMLWFVFDASQTCPSSRRRLPSLSLSYQDTRCHRTSAAIQSNLVWLLVIVICFRGKETTGDCCTVSFTHTHRHTHVNCTSSSTTSSIHPSIHPSIHRACGSVSSSIESTPAHCMSALWSSSFLALRRARPRIP